MDQSKSANHFLTEAHPSPAYPRGVLSTHIQMPNSKALNNSAREVILYSIEEESMPQQG